MLDGDEDVVMDARDDAINCPASEGLEEEDTITLEQEVHVEEDEFVHDEQEQGNEDEGKWFFYYIG